MPFNPYQIVCLENQDNFLYSEVIQVIPTRQFCWVRPLMLVISLNQDSLSTEQELIDVRTIADLILPLRLFRPAFDTEMIPLYSHLEESDFVNSQNSCSQLHEFIQQIWQNNPDIFKIQNSNEVSGFRF